MIVHYLWHQSILSFSCIVLIFISGTVDAADKKKTPPKRVRLSGKSDLRKYWSVVEGKSPTFKRGSKEATFSGYCRLVTKWSDWQAFDITFMARGKKGYITVFWGASEDGTQAVGSITTDSKGFQFTNSLNAGVSTVADEWLKVRPTFKFGTEVRQNSVTITLPLSGHTPFTVENAKIAPGYIGIESEDGAISGLDIRLRKNPRQKVVVAPGNRKDDGDIAQEKNKGAGAEDQQKMEEPVEIPKEAGAARKMFIGEAAQLLKAEKDHQTALARYEEAHKKYGELAGDYAMWCDLKEVAAGIKKDKTALVMSASEKEELAKLDKLFSSKSKAKKAERGKKSLDKAKTDLKKCKIPFQRASQRLIEAEKKIKKLFPDMVWDESVKEKEKRLAALDVAKREAQKKVGTVDSQGRRTIATAVVGIIPLSYGPDTVWVTRGRYYHKRECSVLKELKKSELHPMKMGSIKNNNRRIEMHRACPRCDPPPCKKK